MRMFEILVCESPTNYRPVFVNRKVPTRITRVRDQDAAPRELLGDADKTYNLLGQKTSEEFYDTPSQSAKPWDKKGDRKFDLPLLLERFHQVLPQL